MELNGEKETLSGTSSEDSRKYEQGIVQVSFGVRTTDRAAAGSTRGSGASQRTGATVLPKSVTRSQKSVTSKPAATIGAK